jgi:hypothetical protein
MSGSIAKNSSRDGQEKGAYQAYVLPAHRPKLVTNWKEGYRIGYRAGWESSDTYPKGAFSLHRASKGFHDGMRNKRRYDKYQRHFN